MAGMRYDCAETDDLAGLFVLDALTAEEAAAVTAHLSTCSQPHDAFTAMAAATSALAASVEPVEPPEELRARVLAAVAATPQVPDQVRVVVRGDVGSASGNEGTLPEPVSFAAPSRAMSGPISIDAARQRRGPSRLAWVGLAAAAAIVIAALGAWNVTLQREVSDAQGQVARLQEAVTTAQQDASVAAVQVASLETRIAETQTELTAAIARADTSDAQVASLRGQIDDMQVQLASYQQQIAVADERIGLIGQAVGAAVAPDSNVATLTSTEPGGLATGMAIFPTTGTGYLMIEGLPEIASDQTYQAWFLAGGQPTSAGVVEVGPHGLAIVGGVDPIAGTDTIALTIEPAGGVDQPTGSPVVAGQLPTVVALVPAL